MSVYSQTSIHIDADAIVVVRPPDRPGGKALDIDAGNYQFALTFQRPDDLDRMIRELQILRGPVAADGGAAA